MHRYIVALQTGGLMEDPEVRYSEVEVVEAESPQHAEEIYNKKHKCNFFYGVCMAGSENAVITIYNDDVTYAWVKMIK
jgi:hypothetical protein